MELLCSEVAPKLLLIPLQLVMPLREQGGRQGGGIYTIGIGKHASEGIYTGNTNMNTLLTEPRTGLLYLHDFAKTLKPVRSPGRPVTLSGGGDGRARASRTQAEEVDSTIVQKVADMPGVLGHRAEGVCTAGCKGVHTAGAHVHEHGP